MDSDTRSARAIHPPFLLRGSHAAVGARAPLREITAGTPLIPGRRRRETALTPLSPVVLLVHLGRRPGRRETAGLSSSLVVDRFIHDSPRIRGAARLARARHGRTSNDRSYARARYGGAQAVFGYLNDPQPGVVRELYPWTAMCVRNVDVHVSCSSQVDAQLAAFFIDPRAK